MEADPELKQKVIHGKEWTTEQQMQELERRLDIYDRIMKSGSSSITKFTPLSDDVICAVPAKCGTTWLTHICHQIRMQGAEPTFENQTEVVCWIEWSKVINGVDPDDIIQPVNPRIFVTNFPNYDNVPKSDRMIYLYRDQMDTLYSLYQMMDSLLMLKGRVFLSVFANAVIKSGEMQERLGDLVVWWERRHQKNVLFLFYDDLKEDHAGCVRRIANFLGVDCDDEVIARVVHTTRHTEMSKHSSKFESVTHFPDLAQQIGEDSKLFIGRVRKDGGRSGDGQRLLSPELQESFKKLWREIVTAKLGFENLQKMRQAWIKESSDM